MYFPTPMHSGKHVLPDLPYSPSALAPHLSEETLLVHHGKHHRKYVETVNELVIATEFEGLTLEETVRRSKAGGLANEKLFNNAAQAWNHAFYWQCLAPAGRSDIRSANVSDLAFELTRTFGSIEAFRNELTEAISGVFGSGWAWLARADHGRLLIEKTSNAETPIQNPRSFPLMTCDVWEHAYYIDYRNNRESYVQAFWSLADWDFAARRLAQLTGKAHGTAA
jgi:superoxide dismutase, Fe-Mn family